MLVRVDRNLVIPSERNFVDLTPYLEIVIPGDRAAGPQDVLSGRRLERRPDYVAGVPDGIDERMRLVAGTDISEMVGAVGLLIFISNPTIWVQHVGQTFVGLLRVELFI